MAKVLVAVYIAAALGLVAAAAAIWRLHCEGFGCMGVGVAWVAWVVAFFVALGVGLFNGGVLVERFTKPPQFGSKPGLRFRIAVV